MSFIVERTLLLLLHFSLIGSEKIWNPNVEYDFIVVGAGAAGSAIAARLAENENYQVLLLEAGGESPFFTQIPYLAMGPFGGEHDWSFVSEEQKYGSFGFKDKKTFVPRGKGLGGSTFINAMIFTRGNKNDYDHWKSLGNEGWGYDDLLPFFKKLEDYQVPMKWEDEIYHNKGGPMPALIPDYKTSLKGVAFDAYKELGLSLQDYNGPNQTGYFHYVATIRNGSRCSAYTAYLEPNRNKSSLHIVTNAFVTKLKFDDDKKVSGAYFEKNNNTYFAPVKKEIILSAGSNNSPHLLMLSGIGPTDILEKYEIKTISDRQGVGENLQDHTAIGGLIFVFKEPQGFDFLTDVNQDTLELWHSQKKGPLTVPFRSEAISFLKTKYAPKDLDWPDIEIVIAQPPITPGNLKKEYEEIFLTHPNNKMMIALPILMRPKSVGYVRLLSADPHIPLAFQPNYLENEEDLELLLEGVKIIFKVIKTEPFVKLGTKWHGTVIPGCKMHEELSDEYLKCYIRHYTYGVFHQSGTCKMGPKTDPLAVVDSRLRVYGVRGLRVADVSISPSIITGHTMIPAIMIGEKAATMILEDWETHHDKL